MWHEVPSTSTLCTGCYEDSKALCCPTLEVAWQLNDRERAVNEKIGPVRAP